jgi:hypothetical protein
LLVLIVGTVVSTSNSPEIILSLLSRVIGLLQLMRLAFGGKATFVLVAKLNLFWWQSYICFAYS